MSKLVLDMPTRNCPSIAMPPVPDPKVAVLGAPELAPSEEPLDIVKSPDVARNPEELRLITCVHRYRLSSNELIT